MFIAFRAMGIVSEQETVQMIGTDDHIQSSLVPSIKECVDAEISTQKEALRYCKT